MCITGVEVQRNLRIGIPNPVQKQKVGNRSPNDCLPIGNRNIQHNINSLSANTDAIARRAIAYLMNC
ncbi:MAG: hypothetical protein LBU34_16325 [Planctomycetaceae bacterium]|nr:hypothetical protein [Planctomycetaceae bacterium]